MLQILKVIGLLSVARASFIWWDSECPNVRGMPGFDKPRYLGRWYEITRDWDTPGQWMGDCGTDTNSVIDAETGMMQVVYRAWYWYFFFGLFYFNMFGRIVCKDHIGECDVDPSGLS